MLDLSRSGNAVRVRNPRSMKMLGRIPSDKKKRERERPLDLLKTVDGDPYTYPFTIHVYSFIQHYFVVIMLTTINFNSFELIFC